MRGRLLFWSSFVITTLVASAPTFGQIYYQWGVVTEVTSGLGRFAGDATGHQTLATAHYYAPNSSVYCEGWGAGRTLVAGYYTTGYTVDSRAVSYGRLYPPSSTIWTRGWGDAAGVTPTHITLVSARAEIDISGSSGADYDDHDPDSATYQESAYYAAEGEGVDVGHAVYAQGVSLGHGEGEGYSYADTDFWMY